VRGRGLLRCALLTGEAEPVAVESGDHVEAGTVLVDSTSNPWLRPLDGAAGAR
jgi:cation transport ATPase